MTKERTAHWLSIGANVGALIGLLLIAVQLQQSRDLMRAQIRHDLAASIVDLLQTPAENADLANILRRGSRGEDLTPDEQYRFDLRSNALLRYWEDVHYQYREGLYDDAEYAAQKVAWAGSMQGVGLSAYWCRVRTGYSPLFRAELDSLLVRPCDAV